MDLMLLSSALLSSRPSESPQESGQLRQERSSACSESESAITHALPMFSGLQFEAIIFGIYAFMQMLKVRFTSHVLPLLKLEEKKRLMAQDIYSQFEYMILPIV